MRRSGPAGGPGAGKGRDGGRLPALWGEATTQLVEVIGTDKALALFNDFGGQDSVYIPKTPRPDHPWAASIGFEALQALCRTFGGERIGLPHADRRSCKKVAIMADLAEGRWSNREIARRRGVTDRYVRMVARELDQG